MCNACGFMCCAWDGLGECGCDHCDHPDCWSDDQLEALYGDDDDADWTGPPGQAPA